MAYPGYVVEYFLRWPGKKSAYVYQRFFRALYGYTQVVSKSNGRVYRYHRPGVLTGYPFIKMGKNTVVVPPNALQPLLRFLKTGQNPAHSFEALGNWQELVKYSMSETFVASEHAADAVYSALSSTYVSTAAGRAPVLELLNNMDVLLPDELYSVYYAVRGILSSEWYPAFSSDPRYSTISETLGSLQARIV